MRDKDSHSEFRQCIVITPPTIASLNGTRLSVHLSSLATLESIRDYLLRWFLISDVIAYKMIDVVPRIRPMIVDASDIIAKLVTSRWYDT